MGTLPLLSFAYGFTPTHFQCGSENNHRVGYLETFVSFLKKFTLFLHHLSNI